MPHIIPIVIEGGSINIEFSSHFKPCETPLTKERESLAFTEEYPSKITRVQITGANKSEVLSFAPVDGKCRIEIYYEHPEDPRREEPPSLDKPKRY